MLSSTSDLSQPLSSSSLLQDEPLGVSSTTPAPVPTPALVVAAPSSTTAPAATAAPLSGSTLLQRIQAQRARELQQPQPQVLPTTQQQQPLPTTSFTNGTPAPLVIPNYAPSSQNAMGGGGGRPSSTWFQNLFGGALQRNQYRQVPGQDSSSDALLTHYELANDDDVESPLTTPQQFQQRPTATLATTGPQPYSMAGYFQTFVLDMYNLFRSFPTWAQIAIVILLIYLLWKVW